MSITKRILLVASTSIIVLNGIAAIVADRLMQEGIACSTIFIISGVLSALSLSALVSLVMARFLRPLRQLKIQVKKIAGGDLRETIQYTGNDEIGLLAAELNRMIHSLNSTINGILSSANAVVSSVDMLQRSADKSGAGAREQAYQAAQIAAAAEEMAQTINDIAHNAAAVAETSSKTMNVTSKGRESALAAMQIVGNVTTNVNDLAGMMAGLSTRAEEIGGITTVIKDIADQTSLLALNAAIEAARAGDHGRGFAVVADEVRKLADKTINSTGDISVKVRAVRSETEQTVKSMSNTSRQVSLAASSFSDIGNLLHDIADEAHNVQDQIALIASAMEQQHISAEEVARNVEKTSAIAREMETMSGSVTGEIRELSGIAERLFSAGWTFRLFVHRQACIIVEDVSRNSAIISMDGGRQESFLRSIIGANVFIELFYITDTSGRQTINNIAPAGFQASYGSTGLGMDWSSRPWFKGAIGSKTTHITELYHSAATDSFCFTIATTIADSTGKVAGVLGADINLAKLLASA